MFKTKYTYDDQTLEYKRVPFEDQVSNTIVYSIAKVVVGIFIGVWMAQPDDVAPTNKEGVEVVLPSKHDIVYGSNHWKDSVFNDYQVRADLYLNRPEFKGTPMSGELIALAASNAYDSTGILLPVELCLAQCQWESGMGLKGRSPKNNPFNIGEYDKGTIVWFESTFQGTQSYFYFMCNDYLRCRTLGQLFKNFVNCDGNRYASGQYEQHVPQQYYYIKRWLKKEMTK